MLRIKIEKKEIHNLKRTSIVSTVIALILTLVVSGLLITFLGSGAEILKAFFITPFSSLFGIGEIVTRTIVLVVIALGLALGFRANVWNIGAEGQFTVGAIFGTIVALWFYEVDSFLVLPLMCLAGALGGVLWGGIPAFLNVKLKTNEILTSLMLVYVASLLLSYLVHGPLRDPEGFNFPQSRIFSDSAIFPILLEGTRINASNLFILIIFPVIVILFQYSFIGFQFRVSGLSSQAAAYAGFKRGKVVWLSFLITGGLAGLMGVSEVSGMIGQLTPRISPGYGFTAIIVAFLGRLNPYGILFAGLLMALIYIGAETVQLDIGLPVSIAGIFQGLVLFSLLSSDFFIRHKIVFYKKN